MLFQDFGDFYKVWHDYQLALANIINSITKPTRLTQHADGPATWK